jgi:hypothetical protein
MDAGPAPALTPALPCTDASRRRMAQLMDEVGLLINHVQCLPETRLPHFFGQLAQVRQERENAPLPPTWDLAYFLGRLAAIEATGPEFHANAISAVELRAPTAPPVPISSSAEAQAESTPPPPTAPPPSRLDPGPSLTDFAFLSWSRDFLSSIAYPTTVETILITKAFRVARMAPRRSWTERAQGLVARLRGAPPPHRPPLPSGPDGPLLPTTELRTLLRYGERLAWRVGCLARLTAALIVFSMWASFLVYSGRVLIRENAALRGAYAELATRMQLADRGEERTALLAAFTAAGGTDAQRHAHLCELSLPPLPAGPLPASVDWSPQQRTYLTAPQRALCAEWGALDRRAQELKLQHAFWLQVAAPLYWAAAPWMLVQPRPTIDGCPPGREQIACAMQRLDLETHRYGMEQMVDGLIGAVLPVAYALLGSLAGLFRTLNLRADREWLSPGDYGATRNTLVLGVVTGTVVGLFSDSMGWASHSSASIPLGPTALALLAGFASERVFALFDTISARVFGTAMADRPARAPAAG